MPRRARLMLPDVAVHAIQRGNNRSVCFPAENDYRHYLFQMGRLAPEHGCAIHAYCLMPNHVHLLLTPKEADSCAQMMQRLAQCHAQYINDRYGRTGTLWEGRFRSSLVQSGSYVLACYRYIEMNPVRAALAAEPAAYPWSSFKANGEGRADKLIVPHVEFLALGNSVASRLAAYRQLFAMRVDGELDDEIRTASRGGFALGGDMFKRELAVRLGRRAGRGKPGRPTKAGKVPDRQLAMDL